MLPELTLQISQCPVANERNITFNYKILQGLTIYKSTIVLLEQRAKRIILSSQKEQFQVEHPKLVRRHSSLSFSRIDLCRTKEPPLNETNRHTFHPMPFSNIFSPFFPGEIIGPIGELCSRGDPYGGYACARNEKIGWPGQIDA